MKHLGIIEDDEEDLEGFTDVEDSLYVNIEKIWNDCGDEYNFIKRFSKVYTHELLHIMIKDIINEWKMYKEEEIVRILMKERFTKDEKKYYI